MAIEVLHPVRFSKEQIDFMELMIYASGNFDEDSREWDILSTIKESGKKNSKPLTEGKMLCGVKKRTTSRPLYGPPPGRSDHPKVGEVMYRRIEICWDELHIGAKIRGTVSIIEGANVASMKVVAKFGINYEMSRSYRLFKIGSAYLPKLTDRTRAIIDTMGQAYTGGLNQKSEIYAWEENPSWD